MKIYSMKNWMPVKIGTIALLLGACGSASDIAKRNPDYFSARHKDGTISGTYNPAGFTTNFVQAQIKSMCIDERLGTYGESDTSNGLVLFEATCAEG